MINGKAYPSGEEINRTRLEEYKAQFLDHEAPKGFRNCWEPGKNLFYDEACFKASIVVELRKARKEEKDDKELGERAVVILNRKRPGASLLSHRLAGKVKKISQESPVDLYSIIGRLIRSSDTGAAIVAAYNELEGTSSLSFGERICMVFTAGMWNPKGSAPVQKTHINPVWNDLTGKPLFEDKNFDVNDAYRKFEIVFDEIFQIMDERWHWQPRHWTDVQSFLRVISRLDIL